MEKYAMYIQDLKCIELNKKMYIMQANKQDLSIYLFIYLSIYLSICIFYNTCIYIYVYIYIYIYI